jgi:hypothetical protein
VFLQAVCALTAGLCLWPLLQAFVAGLPVRALRGVGYKSESVLRGWGVVSAGDAAALSKQMLVQGLGEKQGERTLCFHLFKCLLLTVCRMHIISCAVSCTVREQHVHAKLCSW